MSNHTNWEELREMSKKRPAQVQVQQHPNKAYNTSDPSGMANAGIDEWVYRVGMLWWYCFAQPQQDSGTNIAPFAATQSENSIKFLKLLIIILYLV